MKKYIFLTIVAIFTFCICFLIGCEKNDAKTIEIQEQAEIKASSPNPPGVNIIIVSATLRRAVDKPGKRCQCFYCLGFCDFEWFPILKSAKSTELELKELDEHSAFVLFEIDSKNNNAIAYVLNKKDYFEKEFGVDIALEIPSEALVGTELKHVLIKEGLYEFNEITETVNYKDKKLTSYGKVVLDIDFK
jgi:hypothetical protein